MTAKFIVNSNLVWIRWFCRGWNIPHASRCFVEQIFTPRCETPPTKIGLKSQFLTVFTASTSTCWCSLKVLLFKALGLLLDPFRDMIITFQILLEPELVCWWGQQVWYHARNAWRLLAFSCCCRSLSVRRYVLITFLSSKMIYIFPPPPISFLG